MSEKACDMMWRERLLIKLKNLGVGGRIFNWIKDFMNGQKIQERIGRESRQYVVENGTPQGSVISLLLFSVMINDIFSDVKPDIGRYSQMMEHCEGDRETYCTLMVRFKNQSIQLKGGQIIKAML